MGQYSASRRVYEEQRVCGMIQKALLYSLPLHFHTVPMRESFLAHGIGRVDTLQPSFPLAKQAQHFRRQGSSPSTEPSTTLQLTNSQWKTALATAFPFQISVSFSLLTLGCCFLPRVRRVSLFA